MWGKTMGIMSRLKNLLSHKKENTLKISIVPGVNVVEVTGLIPGQIVEVTATNSVGTGPAATYVTPSATEVPGEPVVTD